MREVIHRDIKPENLLSFPAAMRFAVPCCLLLLLRVDAVVVIVVIVILIILAIVVIVVIVVIVAMVGLSVRVKMFL